MLIGLALAAPAATTAFVVTSPSTTSRAHSTLSATRNPNDDRATPADAIRNLAAASALTLGLLLPSTDALAVPDTLAHYQSNNNAVLSSSVDLSAAIRTMDFSLPSGSYDSIADPNASGKDELTKDTIINTTPSRKKKEDSGVSAKEAAAAARAERVAERKAKEAEQSIKDEQAAKERDENIKAMRLEKAAKRAEAQAEKEAAAAAEKDEAKFKGAKFVDTSMPTY